MAASDFAELHEKLKSGDLDKSKIWVESDEGIVSVFHDGECIFSAYEINFAWAFFMLCGVNIDDHPRTNIVRI